MINFREIEIDDAKMILDWRTSKRVSEFMHSDINYDLEKQVKWLDQSFNNSSYYHWIVQHKGEDVGLLNFADWDLDNKTTSWGFYIAKENTLGIGALVPPYFYNFAFDVLEVETVFAKVFYNNISVIDLHLKQGYTFDFKQDYLIEKGGKAILIVCMSLDKKIFKNSMFSQLKQNFPLQKWKANPISK